MIWGGVAFIVSWFELVYLIKTSYKLTWRKSQIEKPINEFIIINMQSLFLKLHNFVGK